MHRQSSTDCYCQDPPSEGLWLILKTLKLLSLLIKQCCFSHPLTGINSGAVMLICDVCYLWYWKSTISKKKEVLIFICVLQRKHEDRFSINFNYRQNLKYVSYFMVKFILNKKRINLSMNLKILKKKLWHTQRAKTVRSTFFHKSWSPALDGKKVLSLNMKLQQPSTSTKYLEPNYDGTIFTYIHKKFNLCLSQKNPGLVYVASVFSKITSASHNSTDCTSTMLLDN